MKVKNYEETGKINKYDVSKNNVRPKWTPRKRKIERPSDDPNSKIRKIELDKNQKEELAELNQTMKPMDALKVFMKEYFRQQYDLHEKFNDWNLSSISSKRVSYWGSQLKKSRRQPRPTQDAVIVRKFNSAEKTLCVHLYLKMKTIRFLKVKVNAIAELLATCYLNFIRASQMVPPLLKIVGPGIY